MSPRLIQFKFMAPKSSISQSEKISNFNIIKTLVHHVSYLSALEAKLLRLSAIQIPRLLYFTFSDRYSHIVSRPATMT